jgi:Fe-S-cluster-containing hydrogenase component 2
MNSIRIEASKCPKNHYCPVIKICPSGAISQKNPFSAPEIDQEKCTFCGKCTKYCGYEAFLKL